jgi:hypothetical protein
LDRSHRQLDLLVSRRHQAGRGPLCPLSRHHSVPREGQRIADTDRAAAEQSMVDMQARSACPRQPRRSCPWTATRSAPGRSAAWTRHGCSEWSTSAPVPRVPRIQHQLDADERRLRLPNPTCTDSQRELSYSLHTASIQPPRNKQTVQLVRYCRPENGVMHLPATETARLQNHGI